MQREAQIDIALNVTIAAYGKTSCASYLRKIPVVWKGFYCYRFLRGQRRKISLGLMSPSGADNVTSGHTEQISPLWRSGNR